MYDEYKMDAALIYACEDAVCLAAFGTILIPQPSHLLKAMLQNAQFLIWFFPRFGFAHTVRLPGRSCSCKPHTITNVAIISNSFLHPFSWLGQLQAA